MKPFRGGLGGEVPGLDALARLACWQNLFLPTSSSGGIMLLALGTALRTFLHDAFLGLDSLGVVGS